MQFETLKEQHAKRNPEDLEIDYGNLYFSTDFVILNLHFLVDGLIMLISFFNCLHLTLPE